MPVRSRLFADTYLRVRTYVSANLHLRIYASALAYLRVRIRRDMPPHPGRCRRADRQEGTV